MDLFTPFVDFTPYAKHVGKSDPNVGSYKNSGNSHQDISAIKVRVSVNLQVPAAEVHVRESLDELLSWLTCDLRHRIGYKHTQYLIQMLINKISVLLDVHTGFIGHMSI